MGILDKAFRNGVSNLLNKAVGGAVKEVATLFADRTNAQIGQASAPAPQHSEQSNVWQSPAQSGGLTGLKGTLGQLQRSLESYANVAAQNMKTCSACGEVASANMQFCPACGAKLSEQTIAQGAVCASCGRPNNIGTRFCQGCGAKLPFAIAEEQAAAVTDAATLAQWDAMLAGFPKWTLGGSSLAFDAGQGYTMFSVTFVNAAAARYAVEEYKAILRQNDFREAGEYPDKDHLFKMIGSTCYHVDTEHCFEGDSETADIYFRHDEPAGGFDYVKPQRSSSLFDLFK